MSFMLKACNFAEGEHFICFPGNFDCFQNISATVVCEALLVITSAGNKQSITDALQYRF